MYGDILTMCWSIKEVNKNLSDRQATQDYSINYLKNACSMLAGQMRELGRAMPDERMEVISKNGSKKLFTLNEVSEMLYDTRKIIELNLIDNINRWAQAHNS